MFKKLRICMNTIGFSSPLEIRSVRTGTKKKKKKSECQASFKSALSPVIEIILGAYEHFGHLAHVLET